MITIDDREVVQHPEIPDLLDIPCVIQRLEAADFAFLDRDNEPTGIERSEIGNLIQKLRSGELEDQMYKCQANYASVILLIEGVYDKVDGLLAVHRQSDRGYFRTHIYPHTRYDYIKALEIRLSEMGIELIYSPNFECSIVIVKTIYNQRTKSEEDHHLFRKIRAIKIPVKISSNPSIPRLMSLCPRISEKVAVRLIYKYDTIWAVATANEKDLLETKGFGKTLIRRLKDNLGVPNGL